MDIRLSFLLTVIVFTNGCKIVQTVGPGGSVVSESGSYDCAEDTVCEIDVPNGRQFVETFTAVPNAGYEFDGWRSTESYLCVSDNATCVIDLPALVTRYDATAHMTAEFSPVDGGSSDDDVGIVTIIQKEPPPEDPHYTIIQNEGQIQYWMANDAEPAQALHIGPDGQRTRIFDDDEGAIDLIVNESTGEFIKVLYRDEYRTDVLMFDSVGKFMTGYAVINQDGEHYIGSISGTSDFVGYLTNGGLSHGDEGRVANFVLYAPRNAELDYTHKLPDEFNEMVREFEETMVSSDVSISGFMALNAASTTTRARLVKGLAALLGGIVAIKTGQGPSFILGGIERAVGIVKDAVFSKMRGQDVTRAVVEGVVDSLSICNLFIRSFLIRKMCEASIDYLAGELKGNIIRHLADIVLREIHPDVPKALSEANLVVETVDYAKQKLFPGQEPTPPRTDAQTLELELPKLARPIKLVAEVEVTKTTSSEGDAVAEYALHGEIDTDGTYEVSGCPVTFEECTSDDRLSMRGQVTRNEDGSFERQGSWIVPPNWPPDPTNKAPNCERPPPGHGDCVITDAPNRNVLAASVRQAD